MRSFKISIVFIAFMCLFATSNLQAWDTFSYESTVDSLIPPEGNPGIWDTISVPVDIIIEDLNVYVEIETFSYIAGSLGNTLTSPWQDTVTICYRNGDRVLPLWFDTDDDEDGPGDLNDYNGLNAYGEWEMYVYIFADSYPLTWDSWALEIIGEPLSTADEALLPLTTGLNDIYPNPFNSTAVIHYSLENPAMVNFSIYNILGEIVRTYKVDHQAAGYYQLKWDGVTSTGQPAASGVYYTRMVADGNTGKTTFTRKLTLLK